MSLPASDRSSSSSQESLKWDIFPSSSSLVDNLLIKWSFLFLLFASSVGPCQWKAQDVRTLYFTHIHLQHITHTGEWSRTIQLSLCLLLQLKTLTPPGRPLLPPLRVPCSALAAMWTLMPQPPPQRARGCPPCPPPCRQRRHLSARPRHFPLDPTLHWVRSASSLRILHFPVGSVEKQGERCKNSTVT